MGKELELVPEIFWRKQGAVGEPADVLRAINDLQLTGDGIDEPGVAGFYETVRRQRFGRLRFIPKIADEHAG